MFIGYVYTKSAEKWKKRIADKLKDVSLDPVDCDGPSAKRSPKHVRDTINECDAFIGLFTVKNDAPPMWVFYEACIAYANNLTDDRILILVDEDFNKATKIPGDNIFKDVYQDVLIEIGSRIPFNVKTRSPRKMDETIDEIVSTLKNELLPSAEV